MARVAWTGRLRPDKIQEYEVAHANVWPEMLKMIKGRSSHWMNGLPDLGYRFDWQEGYAAFSVSESQIAAVRRYIQTQEQHHARRTFHEELVTLLRKHGFEFDEDDLLD